MKRLVLAVCLMLPVSGFAVEKMTPQEAVQVMESVYTQFRGTIQEHQVIQEALKTLKELAEKPKK